MKDNDAQVGTDLKIPNQHLNTIWSETVDSMWINFPAVWNTTNFQVQL